jgi:adenylosuccinate synthase
VKAYAVIGANYGDEGKGLVTNYLCHEAGTTGAVVRFNGGAQAGHTVTLRSGARHIFHHFGCGTFLGWPTFLSKHFICNPLLFVEEMHALGYAKVYCDPRALVTTPYDMLLNQAVEQMRGDGRHGSCGVGINETVERCSHPEFRLTAEDLTSQSGIWNKLLHIRDYWVPKRRYAWGLGELQLPGDEMLDDFLRACRDFMEACTLQTDKEFLSEQKVIVFEGAQGLALDQRSKDFPHVSRSNTGLRNVLELCRVAEIKSLEAWYVTRAYFTRHGAGPLPYETYFDPAAYRIEDKTNVPHPFQGTLRYAPMCRAALWTRINDDYAHRLSGPMRVTRHMAVTCTDQVVGSFPYMADGYLRKAALSYKEMALFLGAGTSGVIYSTGPTLNDVQKVVTSSSPSLEGSYSIK